MISGGRYVLGRAKSDSGTPTFTSLTRLARATRCGKSGWHIKRSKSSNVGGNGHVADATRHSVSANVDVAADSFGLRFGTGVWHNFVRPKVGAVMMKSSKSLSQTSIDRFDALKRGSNVGVQTGFGGVSIIGALRRADSSIGEMEGNLGGSSRSVSIVVFAGLSNALCVFAGCGWWIFVPA